MAKYEELMSQVLNLSVKDRIELGKQTLKDTMTVLSNHGVASNDTAYYIVNLIKLFVSADKICSQEEYDIVRAITEVNFTKERFIKLTKGGYDKEFVNKVYAVIDKLNLDEKKAICLFGLSILASDEMLTKEEQDLFDRLCE